MAQSSLAFTGPLLTGVAMLAAIAPALAEIARAGDCLAAGRNADRATQSRARR
jgi:hypothetical protein